MLRNSGQADPKELQRFARQVDRAIKTCESWERSRRRSEQLDDTAELINRQFDRASAYANLIIAAGYAAFFVAWSSLQPSDQPRLHAAAALAILASATGFLGWEVFKMTHMGIIYHRVIPLLDAEPGNARVNLDRIRQVLRAHNLWIARLWLPWLIAILASGLAGAAMLVTLFVIKVLA
ncbi:MAG: hypothetical protein IT431_00920 [Phycisphaerales bacterium]|nr:hypothetical protein [Phycisphaerales bacterium]